MSNAKDFFMAKRLTEELNEMLADVKSLQLNHPEKNDIIQIVPTHKWGGCLAVVDEAKPWGVQAYVAAPVNSVKEGPTVGRYYIRLQTGEFEVVGPGVKPPFILADDE